MHTGAIEVNDEHIHTLADDQASRDHLLSYARRYSSSLDGATPEEFLAWAIKYYGDRNTSYLDYDGMLGMFRLGGGVKPYDRTEAVMLMSGSRSREEWDANLREVERAWGGELPDWWQDSVVRSGLESKVRKSWGRR